MPLLSIISGFLIAETLNGRPYATIVKRKIQSLLVPLVMWNLVLIGLFFVFKQTVGGEVSLPDTAKGWADAIFALTAAPANIQLAFLRDLFVCAILSPLLLVAVRHSVVITTAVVFALAVINPENPILLRPMILFFFVMGLAVWQYKINYDLVDRHGLALTAALAVIGTAKIYVYFAVATNTMDVSVYFSNIMDVIMRMTVTLWFWWVTGKLYVAALTEYIKKCEPFIFIVFCSHIILFKIMSILGNGPVGGYNGEWYPLFYFSQPVAAMIVGYAIYKVGLSVFPAVLAVLNGKETRSAA